MTAAPSSLDIAGLKLLRRGKVRDVYELGPDTLLIVASDRLSAFDVILPDPIPGKGKILTAAAVHWFRLTQDIVPNHLLASDREAIMRVLPKGVKLDDWFDGRMMLVRKAKRVDAECVARGYLAGSGWKEYKATGIVGGHKLPAGLLEAGRLPTPIFTPATKADEGHDENITRERLASMVGKELADNLERLTLGLFARASTHLEKRGLILADTKFEFGFIDGQLALIDEILTPDSSRVWEQKDWKPGKTPDGFDKQFVRDWLERSGWDKRPPAPELPSDVVEGTLSRYREFLRKVTQ